MMPVLPRALLDLPSENSDGFVAVFSIALGSLSAELSRDTLKQECPMQSEYLALLVEMRQQRSVP